MPDGTVKMRKYNTAQLMRMLAEGTIAVTARGSHHPVENFRSLSTFKEFQGLALGKVTKKAADENSARTRGLFKRIEEAERQREADENVRKGEGETAVSANAALSGAPSFSSSSCRSPSSAVCLFS